MFIHLRSVTSQKSVIVGHPAGKPQISHKWKNSFRHWYPKVIPVDVCFPLNLKAHSRASDFLICASCHSFPCGLFSWLPFLIYSISEFNFLYLKLYIFQIYINSLLISLSFILNCFLLSSWLRSLCSCHLSVRLIHPIPHSRQQFAHQNNLHYRLAFLLWRWIPIFPPRLYPPIKLHGAVSQNPAYLNSVKNLLQRWILCQKRRRVLITVV